MTTRRHEEHDMQAAFFKACEHIPECKWMHAIPNAMPGGVRAQVWMNAEGRMAGVCDVFLPWSQKIKCTDGVHIVCITVVRYSGLYLEAKKPTGKLTKEQAEFIAYADHAGFAVAIFRSVQQGVDIVQRYLRGEHENEPALAEARRKLKK
jgi:hypothetical protein